MRKVLGMMAEKQTETRPAVVILTFEPSLLRMMSEVFQLEGYRVIVSRSADEVRDTVKREGGRYVVLMDNFR